MSVPLSRTSKYTILHLKHGACKANKVLTLFFYKTIQAKLLRNNKSTSQCDDNHEYTTLHSKQILVSEGILYQN